MSISIWLQYLLPFLLVLSLAVPAALRQVWLLFFMVLTCGVLWIALLSTKKVKSYNTFFVLFSILTAWGYFEGIAVILLSATICLNLAAWNIANFRAALAQVDRVDNLRQMESARLKRLGLTLAAVFLLTLIPTLVQIKLSFLLIAVLILSSVILLGRMLIGLQPEKDDLEKPESR